MSAARRWLERMLFAPDGREGPQRLLGLLVLGVVALGAWLIFWPFIPTVIGRIVVGFIDLVALLGSLLSPPPPPPTPVPLPSPSPSPSPTPIR